MRIVLPKTLAEPLTIPWQVISHDVALIDLIRTGIYESLEYRKEHDYTPTTNPTVTSMSVLTSIEELGTWMGGFDVSAWSFPGDIDEYHTAFRTREDGRMIYTVFK